MRHASIALLLGTALCAMAPAASAQMYRWVDENGVVNYGDRPPPARAKGARAVSENAGSLSVVPGISKDEMQRLRERDEQQRIQQLERENEELRARDRARAAKPPETVVQEVYVPAYGYPGAARPPHRPPGVRPEPPVNRPKPPVRPQPKADAPLFTSGK